MLQSVRDDIEAGYVRGLETRARDELSGDLLETADRIVGSGVILHPPSCSQSASWRSMFANAPRLRMGASRNVTANEAPRIISGVRDFIVRHPR